MFFKKIKFILILVLFYQTAVYSKSNSFNDLNSRSLSKYFSGIVASENLDNSKALDFFNSSKSLLNDHDPYLKRYIYSLVLANKVPQAINVIKKNKGKKNSDFFDAHLLLILDSLKKNHQDKAYIYSMNTNNFNQEDKLNAAIIETLREYIYVFKENKILENQKDFGRFSIISETFQRCHLGDMQTDTWFSNLINTQEGNYTRYVFFYLSYLIEKNKVAKANEIIKNIDYINTTLLLSQAKSWIDSNNEQKFLKVFFCLKRPAFSRLFFYEFLSPLTQKIRGETKRAMIAIIIIIWLKAIALASSIPIL